jgi:NAD(P)-dependent dehydrogenase (short-subunit alcohol dehydrogenase family)
MRAAIPVMLETGGGAIVNVSSVGGLFGSRGGAAYAASKHGLIGLTKNVAATYGRDGIRANAVCPGAVDTGISLGGVPSPKGLAALNTTLPANPRAATALEIAKVVLFLVSDDASFTNGAAIVVDGGWTAA